MKQCLKTQPLRSPTQHLRATAALALALSCASTVTAQNTSTTTAAVTAPIVASPYYSAKDALEGLYQHHMLPRAQAFEAQARTLAGQLANTCGQAGSASALQDTAQQTLSTWQALATPALGPIIQRRSQRQIDFWPMRPALLARTLKNPPSTLADMERVGGPAKGFPTLTGLLEQTPSPQHCAYATLIAQDIAAEAQTLAQAFAQRAGQPFNDEQTVAKGFAEWINQWLGGWERLRWAYIEQPLKKAQTMGGAPEWARSNRAANLADWRAQWRALQAQARLRPDQVNQPPQPGQALIPIESLLLGKGHIALAARWAQALDVVQADFAALTPASTNEDLLTLSRHMKAVTTLYHAEVAAALDVPLGFSDADGD